MSKEERSRVTLSRRGFLQGVGTAAIGLTAAGGLASTSTWLAHAESSEHEEEKVAYLCHQFHCLGGCCLKCTVRDGRLVLIEPNDALAPEDRRICLRGINEIQHVYSKDRIQTPLKRVGERGSGEFVQISWDEAIDTIANEIKKARDTYGPQAFFYRKSTEASVAHNVEWLGSLLKAETGGRWGLDRGSANGFDPAFGSFAFLPKSSLSEVSKTKTFINLGANLLESGIVWSKAMFEAKEAGAWIATIDPRFSPTASKSHKWIPVLPGTDAALVLGMVQLVLSKGWYDEAFMKSNTSLPFLIDAETMNIAGEPAVWINPKKKEQPYTKAYVWDSVSNSPQLYDAPGVIPALEGNFEFEGKHYITQFDLLKKDMAAYTLDWASNVTGVDAKDIEELTEKYALNRPSIINFGLGGPDKYTNADILGHGMAILTALTGNFGVEGAGTGFYGTGGGFYAAELNPWILPEEYVPGDTGISMYDMPYEKNDVHVALTFGDAFTLETGNVNKMLEWVKSLDFFAICDIYHSSAVDYADIVLPACTKFESTEEVTDLRDSKNYVALGQKCIDPLFESKCDLEVERLIAAKFGLDHLMPQTQEEFARHMLTNCGPNMEGITYESLMKSQGVARIKGSEVPIKAYQDQVYATPTTKIELYYENKLEDGLAFPQYELPDEAYDENPLKEKYPLVFMQGKTRFRIHAYYSASSWFQEYYGPHVDMSAKDAADRGIEHGDDVEVFNDRGSFICKAFVNAGIRPGTLFMAETTYSKYYKAGLLQNVTNSARNKRVYKLTYGPQIPYNDTLVEIRKA